jgi:hypothetical protein
LDATLTAFFDELEKIGALTQTLSGSKSAITIPKPGEAKSPVTPTQIVAKSVSPTKKKGVSTSYTRSNVEAPGTDVTLTADQKSAAPPPITV